MRDGSSPHTRGALACAISARRLSRIIPAYAGSTDMDCLSLPTPPDHPRIRGEHHGYFAFRVMMVGSSPHTRGALADGQARRVQAGIIPAYAGSTPTLRPRGGRRGDHPRIRGEHVDKQLARPFFDGSSPHTRGALHQIRHCAIERGIIPAYAGSTDGDLSRISHVADHPRIRGEHDTLEKYARSVPGSSPRVCIGILMRSSTWRSIFICRGGTFPGK